MSNRSLEGDGGSSFTEAGMVWTSNHNLASLSAGNKRDGHDDCHENDINTVETLTNYDCGLLRFGDSPSHADISLWKDLLGNSTAEEFGPNSKDYLERARQEEYQELLNVNGFDMPEGAISNALIEAFIQYVLPVHPILDWSQVVRLYEADRLSPLLLNAIYLVAIPYVPEQVYRTAGFESRYTANLSFYKRAKALYDANYEDDPITTLQALVLMAYWWGGPTEQKDSWYWLGIAAVLAQSLGMHRALAPPLPTAVDYWN
ncbi:hypothetical protein AnigIFM60653_009924 [Aspergillus niger]|nr:hypothetical protein AnigIFM50267_011802 [Aspergillus niger]GLA08393.1 hypothetical protein AnigIFM60653_009924 [Aspergillus niger]GLA19265.1 hypothetical protein AnigIFM62618_006934 [Aspergillus niger]